jgi:tRNA dimethylallyltransferase
VSAPRPRHRVAVVGPTAAGKSQVALAAARELGDVELVAVDAMQVYRGMDIGTAKPSAAERAEVPHHLVDLVDASQTFTVAQFAEAHDAVMADLAARDRRAVLVGGTGLYHRAVIDDLDLPGEWPAIRGELLREADAQGTAALHARLEVLDPAAASKMEPTNTRRVVRALEVCLGSGRPFSSFGPGLDSYPPSPVVQIGLAVDRGRLADRIEARVHAMVAAGLVGEVRDLHAVGMSRTARQALGYKEVIDHLEGRTSLDAAIEQIVVRTRQFAVRQQRWFRRDPRVRWVHVDDDAVGAALPVVVEALTHDTTLRT